MSIASELQTLNDKILDAYDAVGNKGGTIPQNKNMANMASAISSISGGGGGADNNWAAVMSGQTTALYDNDATALRDNALYTPNATPSPAFLTSVSFPNVLTVGRSVLREQNLVASINMPSLTRILGDYAFYKTAITEISLPSLNYSGSNVTITYTFYGCTNLRKIDFGSNSATFNDRFGQNYFGNCSALLALIIRCNNVVLAGSSSFINTNTSIYSGNGYVYVPSNLIDSYKAANNWKTYASQIRAIEDYSTDGTVNGDIIV